MTALAAARDLFVALDKQGVRYCHWKSNEHVAAGLSGRTDLDVLVDRRQAAETLEVLGRCGYKRFEAAMGMGHPAVEDHIALDRDSGLFLHCHLHYRLVVGDRRFKGYRLCWEDLLLERRVWDAEHGLYVADPSFELLILLVRFAVKLRTRDRLRHVAGRSYVDRKGLLAEYDWLRPRSDRLECLRLCTALLGERASSALEPLLDGPVSVSDLRRFRHAAHAELDTLRSHGRLVGTALQWLRTFVSVVARVSRRHLRLPVPLRRTLPTGGVLVALIGCDRSTRSPVLREFTRILRAKVDVLVVSLDGQRAGAALSDLGLMAHGVMRARGLNRRLRAAWRARNLGMVVVADGYPLAHVGLDESALASGHIEHPSRAVRWLARLEAVPYAWAHRHVPDLVIRLNSPPNSAEHTPEVALDETGPRTMAVPSGSDLGGTRVVDLDADRPLAEVVHDVMAAVWKQL